MWIEHEEASCYAETFAAAASGFQREALDRGFELFHYPYHGEDAPVPTPIPGRRTLAAADVAPGCSVARLGTAEARRCLVIVSGTHGVEGYMGSAAQRSLVRSLSQDTADRVLAGNGSILLIHAMNPWGFLHSRRTTQAGVDLNRNFIDWSAPPPRNERFAELHGLVKLAPDDLPLRKTADPRLADWIGKNGLPVFLDTLARGQYTHPDGLFYGGQTTAWSNRVLQDILLRHCAHAREVVVLDWHTGIGDYAKPYFLCFDEPGSPSWILCERWFGRDALANGDDFSHGKRPGFTGLLFDGIRAGLANAQVVGCVVELGTYPPEVIVGALAVEAYLRTSTVAGGLMREVSEATILRAYYPADAVWRRESLDHASAIQQRAVRALLDW